MNLNKNYENLEQSYLFSTIAKKVNEFIANNPDKKVIRLGIGDVTRPLCKAVTDAMHKAVDEMGAQATFRGYGPEQGYDFLRCAVQNYYKKHNVELELDEIFISDGAKSDLGNILDLFDKDNTVLVPDPVYPVYVDTNIMNGRKVVFANANAENGFLPMPTEEAVDIIYICSPNNPTGAVYTREQLQEWVNSGWLLSNWNLKINKGESDAFTTLAKKVVEINLPYVEIACGPGLGLTPCIKKQNPSLEALISDACPYVVEGWKEVIRKNNLTSNISYASFSNTNMPFKDNSIEVITSYVGIGSTRFNGENGMSAINEIYRVLNKGGYFSYSIFSNKEYAIHNVSSLFFSLSISFTVF